VREKLSLTGAFGVYDAGELVVQGLDASGKIVSTTSLMEVAPDQPVQLSAIIEAFPGIVTVQLLVKTQADEHHLLLAESQI
jgi:hypothetical protein